MACKIKGCFILFMLLSLAMLTGCSNGGAVTYETVSAASIEVGEEIPVPEDQEILTVLGNISVTNQGDTLVFDRPTLEKLGIVQYTVLDPWLNVDVTYSGVLVSELLKHAGVSDSADAIVVSALDGYASDIPMSEIQSHPVLLATQADGTYLTIETNGPTRIIFDYNRHDNLTEIRNMSVWNVAAIEVK
ncbi:MAG: molybdopterin-dependent oxidoreductase [Chloroflexota bacterium]